MKRLRASSNGFTILEVLITIVVIGILSAITFFAYNGIQQRSRDSTRDSDAALIKIALEKYYAENSQFPSVCAGGDGNHCSTSNLSSALRPYLANVPKDPLYANNPNADYRYIRGGTSGNAYALRVTYEAREQCKTGVRVDASWWSVGMPDCTAAGAFVAVAPTITNTSLEVGYTGFGYPYTSNPQGADAGVFVVGSQPISFSVIAGALPAGVTLNPTTGEISGVPTESGTFNFMAEATNAAGSATRAYTLMISGVSPP